MLNYRHWLAITTPPKPWVYYRYVTGKDVKLQIRIAPCSLQIRIAPREHDPLEKSTDHITLIELLSLVGSPPLIDPLFGNVEI